MLKKHFGNFIKKRNIKLYSCIIFMFIVFCAYNNVEAVIKTNLPVSQIRYDPNDNYSVFPDSYKQYIRNIKVLHPNWQIKAVYTGLDWNTSLTHESYDVNIGISTVPSSFDNSWKKDGTNTYIDGTFVSASKKAVAFTMDPRNYLNDSGIFQFESLDFNSAITTDTINKIIYGTEMDSWGAQYKRAGKWYPLGNTWAQLIIDAGKNAGKSIDSNSKGISPIFLASRMRQETSLKIASNYSINGSYWDEIDDCKYLGVYNFFNIKATPNPDGSGSVKNGLIYASTVGWTTPAASINGSATSIWNNYIRYGQNTTYFQKFDVNNPGNANALYAFQYMTNLLAPSSEARTSYGAYLNSGLINSNFVFNVPVYNNMPNAISLQPEFNASSTVIYLDDKTDYGKDDVFRIRSGPGSSYNEIATIIEKVEGEAARQKFTRVATSSSGWDKIRLNDGTEGYVSQSYVYEYVDVKVTGITLNQNTATLKVGSSLKLTPTILPTNAINKTVSWSSSNTGVATVDSTGNIIAKKSGNCVITVKSTDGSNKIVTCNITVENINVTGITLSQTTATLKVGSGLKLTPTILPTNATIKTLTWTSSDITVATVDSTGNIIAKKKGNCVITVKSTDGSNKTATCNVTVENIDVTGITLSQTTATLKVGNTLKLIPTITPTNATIKTVSWSSSNIGVAKVDVSGNITPVSIGDTTITCATVDGNKIATCLVKIEKTLAESISFNSYNFTVVEGGYISILNPIFTPITTTDKTYDIIILDQAIAKVENNRIKGINVGNTTAKIKTKDGSNKETIINIKVNKKVSTTNGLNIEDQNIILKTNLNTTVNFIKEKILTKYGQKIISSNGIELNSNDLLGTGSKVQILDENSEMLEEYTIILSGDVNGDGKISASDYVLIKNYIMNENKNLNDTQLKGSDYNSDKKTNASDYVLIKNYIMKN